MCVASRIHVYDKPNGSFMKTYSAKPGEVERQWHVIDLEGQTVGRAATRIATLLRGKHKPTFTPHVDTGDFVIVVNADKVVFRGNKLDQKKYYRHSGYPGGLTETTAREQLARFPDRVIMSAVRGMLPKNALGRQIIKKLKVYAGPEHPHQAQQPVVFEL
jgi:large subunit ribosomal protein L13